MQKNNVLLAHQAHIFMSDLQTAHNKLIEQLQNILCPKSGCSSCSTCKLIAQKQHPWTFWLEEEESYDLEHIDHIIQATRLKLGKNEKHFFIFSQAQELSIACSNRLLKTIEEPHPGYFFIFLTSRIETLLPTLTSRCFTQQFISQKTKHAYDEFLEPFLMSKYQQPLQWLKKIDQLNIKERETKDIIDVLLQQLHEQLIKLHQQPNLDFSLIQKTTDKIIILKQALEQLPAPGSTKLFWKNIYLAFHIQHRSHDISKNY